MKEKVLETLKTEYSNLGFSDKAFDGVADYISQTVTNEEDINNTVSGVGGLLKVFQGDIDRERSKKSELEKKLEELKQKEPIKRSDETKVEMPKEKDDEVLSKVSELESKLAELIAEKNASTQKQQLKEIAKAKDVPSGLLDYVNVPSDVDLEEFVDSLAQELVNSGLKSKKPVQGQGKPEKLSDSIASYISKKTEEKFNKN